MYELVVGDLEPDLDLVVDVNGEPEDISDALAMELRVALPDQTFAVWALAPLDAVTGKVRHTWLAGETDVPGDYRAQIAVQRGNGEWQTFPSAKGAYVRWRINPTLEAAP